MKDMNRRSFIKTSALAGAAVSLSSVKMVGSCFAQDKVDVAVVKGAEAYDSTKKAVELIGGMSRFVKKDARVVLLPNVQRTHPGTFTHPEVVRAVIHMCKEAGAKEITCTSLLSQKNWDDSGNSAVFKDEGVELKLFSSRDETAFKSVPVPKGKALKEAQILKELSNHDVFINIPIMKDHAGNRFTGTLKNMMGINASASNRSFHKDNWQTDKDSIAHLDQCIADLNTVVTPDLNVLDATEFITTNGPFGPGKLNNPNTVVAGVDRIAIDAYSTRMLNDLKPSDIIMIGRGYDHKLGEIDLSKVNVKEVTI
ncbi:DUF362 domain-containing protein [candidate division KSB1 bacterium]